MLNTTIFNNVMQIADPSSKLAIREGIPGTQNDTMRTQARTLVCLISHPVQKFDPGVNQKEIVFRRRAIEY
jgi:hypothetical protein